MSGLLYDLTIGAYSSAVSGVCGILGSLALARAPLENRKLRLALLQLEQLDRTLGPDTIEAARIPLTRQARRLLEVETKWNLIGVGLLLLSFVILTAGSLAPAPAKAPEAPTAVERPK
ncbi:MAG: hypothetical protein KGM42_07905 [Hyphomicrobiales bacterium]|nr:hypothetical protein [Hyphomicrobiales bacterium]